MGMGISFQYPVGMGMGMGIIFENGCGFGYNSTRPIAIPTAISSLTLLDFPATSSVSVGSNQS